MRPSFASSECVADIANGYGRYIGAAAADIGHDTATVGVQLTGAGQELPVAQVGFKSLLRNRYHAMVTA